MFIHLGLIHDKTPCTLSPCQVGYESQCASDSSDLSKPKHLHIHFSCDLWCFPLLSTFHGRFCHRGQHVAHGQVPNQDIFWHSTGCDAFELLMLFWLEVWVWNPKVGHWKHILKQSWITCAKVESSLFYSGLHVQLLPCLVLWPRPFEIVTLLTIETCDKTREPRKHHTDPFSLRCELGG